MGETNIYWIIVGIVKFLIVSYNFVINERDMGLYKGSRTTDTQWRHKSKISEKSGRCGRQNMLPPYLKIWDWDWIFGCAVKAISSLGVRSPWKNWCKSGSEYSLRIIYECPCSSINLAKLSSNKEWRWIDDERQVFSKGAGPVEVGAGG